MYNNIVIIIFEKKSNRISQSKINPTKLSLNYLLLNIVLKIYFLCFKLCIFNRGLTSEYIDKYILCFKQILVISYSVSVLQL